MTGLRFERLVHRADFERLLGTAIRSRSAHFAIHHLLARPSDGTRPPRKAGSEELSTEKEPDLTSSVDNLAGQRWLGALVPKRHAKRAVTRNLLRREIRVVMSRHAEHLPEGLWLVRVRSGFPTAQFRSAASGALRAEAAGELERLLARGLL